MYPLAADRMKRIRQSGIRRMLERAYELEQAGREVIHFEQGRTDFDTAEPVKRAAWEAMDQGLVHYTLSMGLPETRRAVAGYVAGRLGLEVGLDEVMITVGSSGAIINSFLVLLEPGDEVIVPEPMYLFYLDWPEFFGAKTIPLPLKPEDGYQISEQALIERLGPRTKAIVLNTPHNPTGVCLSRSSLEAVARAARERNLIVIADECYDRIVYPPHEHVSIATLPGMRERTLLCNSLSKSFAMDGWRLGYAIGPRDLLYEMDKAQQHTVINPTTFVQRAAITALELGDRLVEPMVEEYVARRRLILDLVRTDPELDCFEPQGAFYLWLKTGLDMDGWEVTDILLDQGGVALTPGEVFGPSGRGYLRISYSNSREIIKRGMTRVMDILTRLRRR